MGRRLLPQQPAGRFQNAGTVAANHSRSLGGGGNPQSLAQRCLPVRRQDPKPQAPHCGQPDSVTEPGALFLCGTSRNVWLLARVCRNRRVTFHAGPPTYSERKMSPKEKTMFDSDGHRWNLRPSSFWDLPTTGENPARDGMWCGARLLGRVSNAPSSGLRSGPNNIDMMTCKRNTEWFAQNCVGITAITGSPEMVAASRSILNGSRSVGGVGSTVVPARLTV